MAHALDYAEGRDSDMPVNLDAGRLIERFGVEAVYGRPALFLNEMRQIVAVENVVSAVQSRKRSKDWAKWAEYNPSQAQVIAQATILRDDYNNA